MTLPQSSWNNPRVSMSSRTNPPPSRAALPTPSKRIMSDNILVAVHVRPLITREEAESATLHWKIGHEHTITQVDGSNKPVCAPYQFDKVLGIDYDNEGVYTEVAEPIVEAALDGFNGTIFAYGQTSSGKTFTMMGDKNFPGIIPLAIQNIFRGIENTPDREYLIRASYMEIYNESITDLLVGRESRKLLHIREDQSGNVYAADLKEECVNCEKNLLELMRRGDKNRHIGTTNMNERSSRSHTIFRLILESRERSEGDGSEGPISK
nr:centromere-associated protein E-like [Cherax quadricarinatus]